MSESLDLSYLGERASIDFDECSIAAGQASQATQEFLSRKGLPISTLKVLTPGQEDPREIEAITAPAGHYNETRAWQSSLEITGMNPVQIAFIQPLRREITLEPREKQAGLLRKAVVVEEQQETILKVDDPMLVVITEDSIAIPLATFAERTNGTCSYVQIGQEMYDESFIVTPEDENDPTRFEIIEIFRVLLRQSGILGQRSESIIRNLIMAQLAANQEQASQVYEHRLVESYYESAREQATASALLIPDKEGAIHSRNMRTWNIMQLTKAPEGRQVKLVLGSPAQAETLALYAISRENLAIEIATLDHRHKTIEFTQKEIPREEQDTTIQALLILLRQGGKLPLAEMFLNKESTNEEVLIHDVLSSLNIISPQEKNSDHHYISRRREDNTPRFAVTHEEILKFLQFPEVYDNPFPEVSTIDRVLKERQATKDFYISVLDQLHVPEILSGYTGESSPLYEAFLCKLSTMQRQGDNFRGTFFDRSIGKTRGDIEVKASILREDGRFHLQTFYRPTVLEGMGFQELDRFDLDITARPPKDAIDIRKKIARILPILDALECGE